MNKTKAYRLEGVMFDIHFKHDYDDFANKPTDKEILSVNVIADDLESAIKKVKTIFPDQIISAAFCKEPIGGAQRYSREMFLY